MIACRQLRRIRPHAIAPAPLLRAAGQSITAADLFDDATRSALRALPATQDNPHGTVSAFALAFDGALDWTMFGVWLTMVLNRHGEKVLRVKGILNVAGSEAPVAVHGVQHLVHPPMHMAAWPDADRQSRLVFIVDGLDRTAIERSLRAFLASAPQGMAAVA